MGSTTAILTLATVLISLIVSGKALLSKTEIEQVFLTNEQKIKRYYFRLIVFSVSVAVFIGDVYFLWSIFFGDKTTQTVDWGLVFSITLIIFIICLAITGTIERLIQNFCIKHDFIFKVTFTDVNIGEVYILKMLNAEICICSKNANANLSDTGELFLVKLDDLMKLSLSKEQVQKTEQSTIQKLFN